MSPDLDRFEFAVSEKKACEAPVGRLRQMALKRRFRWGLMRYRSEPVAERYTYFYCLLLSGAHNFVFAHSMSDPLSVAAGVVALVTFGVQASSSLLQLIKDFKRAPSTVRTLKEELEALVAVLQALKATIEDTESDFTPLKTPLYQCSKACRDFEAILSHFAGRTHSAKTSFQDWTKLKYLGSDIHGFKDMIAGYKATISIAICNVNL